MDRTFNRHGGLTIVPMPGFESVAEEMKKEIERLGADPNRYTTNVDIAIPKFSLRPSNEPGVKQGKKHIGGHDCFILTSGPGTYEMLGQLNFAIAYLAGRKASRITIMSGYFPLGRSDKDEGDEFVMPPILIDGWKAHAHGKLDRIICVDPHSDQITGMGHTGLVTPIMMTRRILRRVLKDALAMQDKICLAFPDGTARKRYGKVVKEMEKEFCRHIPVVTVDADRMNALEKSIEGMTGDLEALKDALVIAPDDETATGGTQINAAREYRTKLGARDVWAAVTHGVLCGNAVNLFSAPDCPISRLYITDTIPVHNRPALQPLIESEFLRVISLVDDLARVFYHAHWDENVRDLR